MGEEVLEGEFNEIKVEEVMIDMEGIKNEHKIENSDMMKTEETEVNMYDNVKTRVIRMREKKICAVSQNKINDVARSKGVVKKATLIRGNSKQKETG